jgi:hypothetical protein
MDIRAPKRGRLELYRYSQIGIVAAKMSYYAYLDYS